MEKRIVLPDQTAFPSTELMTFGLTKREYFAALAMQGILASCYNSHPPAHRYELACKAVTQADNLIIELNKQPCLH
jgi:hypothetical protein